MPELSDEDASMFETTAHRSSSQKNNVGKYFRIIISGWYSSRLYFPVRPNPIYYNILFVVIRLGPYWPVFGCGGQPVFGWEVGPILQETHTTHRIHSGVLARFPRSQKVSEVEQEWVWHTITPSAEVP